MEKPTLSKNLFTIVLNENGFSLTTNLSQHVLLFLTDLLSYYSLPIFLHHIDVFLKGLIELRLKLSIYCFV